MLAAILLRNKFNQSQGLEFWRAKLPFVRRLSIFGTRRLLQPWLRLLLSQSHPLIRRSVAPRNICERTGRRAAWPLCVCFGALESEVHIGICIAQAFTVEYQVVGFGAFRFV